MLTRIGVPHQMRLNTVSCSEGKTHWWHGFVHEIYDSLTLDDLPEPADLIFVMAGRMERKQYGLELYRAGIAPRLIMSVGRFEVSKMRRLGIAQMDDLVPIRDKVRPEERHFFVTVDALGTQIEIPKLERWSTYGETLAFRKFLDAETVRKVVIVSTDIHLRRVSVSFDRVFRCTPIKFFYCPVPFPLAPVKRSNWWTQGDDRKFVTSELVKLAGYRIILSMPRPLVRRLMRLNK